MGWVKPAATIRLWLASTARVRWLSRNIRYTARPEPPRAAAIISMRPTDAAEQKVKSTAIRPMASSATRWSPERICNMRYQAHSATSPQRIER